jgi:hypothetical protein
VPEGQTVRQCQKLTYQRDLDEGSREDGRSGGEGDRRGREGSGVGGRRRPHARPASRTNTVVTSTDARRASEWRGDR